MAFKKRHIIGWSLLLIVILPWLYVPLVSLASNWNFPDVFPELIDFRHWKTYFESKGFYADLFKSIGLSLSVATVATTLGYLTSRAIAYTNPRLLLFAYFPYLLSPVIYAVCIYFYFVYFDLSGNLGGVVIAQLLIIYPFAVIVLSGLWTEKTRQLEQLSRTLGASESQIALKVLIPVSKNLLLLCLFQTFLFSWFEFGLTNLIGVGKVQTLTIRVYGFLQEANPFLAAVSGLLLMIPPFILLLINRHFVYRKVLADA